VVRARRAFPEHLVLFVDLETRLLQVLHDPLGELLAGIVRRVFCQDPGTRDCRGRSQCPAVPEAGRRAMTAFSKLRQDLAAADRHIAEGQARIAQQADVVCALDADSHDTTDAQNLLRVMQESLDAMNAQRQQIVRELTCAPDERA
jgi:hypothetical protein